MPIFPVAAAQPIKGGIAPGNAPTTVDSEDRVLSGVYPKRYAASVTIPSAAVSQLMRTARVASPATERTMPKIKARADDILPAGSGLHRVRNISPSRSRSMYWFRVPIPEDNNA